MCKKRAPTCKKYTTTAGCGGNKYELRTRAAWTWTTPIIQSFISLAIQLRSLRLQDYATFSQFYKIIVFRIVGDGHQSSPRIPLLRTHFCNCLFKVDLEYITSERRGMLFISCTFRVPEKGNLDVIVFHEKGERTQQGNLLARNLVQMNSYGYIAAIAYLISAFDYFQER